MSSHKSVLQNSSKPSFPITLLPTESAQVARHIQPVALLSIYFLQFPSIVAHTISSLLIGIIYLTIIQSTYCILCLPAAGSHSTSTRKIQKGKLASKKVNVGEVGDKVSTAFIAFLLTIVAIPPITLVQILLGAPATTHLQHTLLSSSHIALLAIYPLVYVHGADSGKWLEILSAQSPLDEVFGGALGVVVGSWLGAVPIPLDWDRDWQRWPITVVTGAYLGYVGGKLLGGTVGKGKRVALD